MEATLEDIKLQLDSRTVNAMIDDTASMVGEEKA